MRLSDWKLLRKESRMRITGEDVATWVEEIMIEQVQCIKNGNYLYSIQKASLYISVDLMRINKFVDCSV